MKRIFLLISLCLVAFSTLAQNELFGKYRTMDEVRYVFVSHAMLEAMAENQEVKVGNYSLNEIRDVITSVLIIRTTTPQAIQQMEQDFAALRADARYQLLIEKGGAQSSTSLFFKNPQGDNEFVLFEESKYFSLFIIITGPFSTGQLTKLLK